MMNKRLALTGICSLLFAVGCYSPEFGDSGGFKCEKDRTCPEGYTCNASTFLCEKGGETGDQGPGTDTTVDGGVTPPEGGPPPTSCRPIQPMAPVGTNLVGKNLASLQFGFFYYQAEDEYWVSFKDANAPDSKLGALYALRKGRDEDGWVKGYPGLLGEAVGEDGGAYSDIVALEEDTGRGPPEKKVFVAYQSSAGLNLWDVLSPTKAVPPDQNPSSVHTIPFGGYHPHFVRSANMQLGAVHAVRDEAGGVGDVWYVTGENDVMIEVPIVLSNSDEGAHGIALSAVGNAASPRDIHVAYYMRSPTFGFEPHYAYRDSAADWYAPQPFETHGLTEGVRPVRLGFSLAADAEEVFQAYIFANAGAPENSESLRFGPVGSPGDHVPFPVPAANPGLAVGGGQAVIFALDGSERPHLVYRGAINASWSQAQPVGSGHANPNARLRAVTVETGPSHLVVAVAFVAENRQLMVGEFECSSDATGQP